MDCKNCKIAMKIIEDILYDLKDRKGIKHSWNEIDDDVQEEIKETWKKIIMNILSEA